ncbi:MAG: homocysteine biosynthesis protein [Chloroflexi bacterium]|nr:homocysteine biosynthesis protein [Chloroflexota bacterium]
MSKTIAEINERISRREAVVLTAEEIIDYVKKEGFEKAARTVDVVTTGTFGPMCSSGMYMNIGHSKPRIKIGGGKASLNDVPAYAGMAAVDLFLGATAVPDDDPKNKIYPGEFRYGGGHVIEDLVAGKDIRLIASGYGTDCYPRKKLETWIRLEDLNSATLFNIRNSFQNYEVAVNVGDRVLYTYMGVLKPQLGNANYSTSGQLSPLLNDPDYDTTGIGTRVFLGGGIGYVAWHGTQHNPHVPRLDNDTPREASGCLALIGDLKQMDTRWLVGTSMLGYGATLSVGVGLPIPVLSDKVLEHTLVTDADIVAPIIDFAYAHPNREPEILGEVSYAELRSGRIQLQGKEVPASSLSSYARAREIALILKTWISEGSFLLTEPVAPLPGRDSEVGYHHLVERPIEE